MDYAEELLAKDRSLSSYIYDLGIQIAPSLIKFSPLSRHYRTTTKRKVHNIKGGIILSCDEVMLENKSLLEPKIHSEIYSSLSDFLNKKDNLKYASNLNFVIIRGNYERVSIIFNLQNVDGHIIKSFTCISQYLKNLFPAIDGAFIFVDPDSSKYYMNFSSGTDSPKLKRLFGNKNLSIKAGNISYFFSPDSFSQVNLSICNVMLDTVVELLKPNGGKFFDLYCGYGFFSCFLANFYESIVGIDYSSVSIDSARENMKRLNYKTKYSFFAQKIERRTLNKLIDYDFHNSHVILDPPKNGTAIGVIEFIASKKPEKVLHIFCGLESIPDEIERWKKSGYTPEKCIPLDMFPGTPDIEVMFLLKPQSSKTFSRLKSGR
jgi:tRNA/tmRNA/rRNA uracil-C5-methylase (TrmA/RlmC/RlmD family)